MSARKALKDTAALGVAATSAMANVHQQTAARRAAQSDREAERVQALNDIDASLLDELKNDKILKAGIEKHKSRFTKRGTLTTTTIFSLLFAIPFIRELMIPPEPFKFMIYFGLFWSVIALLLVVRARGLRNQKYLRTSGYVFRYSEVFFGLSIAIIWLQLLGGALR